LNTKLFTVQNQCLRRITGGYKRTPIAALEREASVPPLSLYTKLIALQHATTVRHHSVETKTAEILDEVWRTCQRVQGTQGQRPQTLLEQLQEKASKKEETIQEQTVQEAST
jgi:hypothetical protein